MVNNAAEIPDINEEIHDEILQLPHDTSSSTDKTFLLMKTEKILALTLDGIIYMDFNWNNFQLLFAI